MTPHLYPDIPTPVMYRGMIQPDCAWCHSPSCICARRMCVCGRAVDWVRDDIAATVQAHNLTPEHAAWRLLTEDGY